MANKAVFLDRDGVINVDHAYVHKAEEFEFIDGVFDACQLFQSLGYKLIIVTNQSGIGRGYYSEQDFHALTEWMLGEFKARNIEIDDVYFCPHHPEKANDPYRIECDCRKPQPGMLNRGIEKFNLEPKNCVMFGDKGSDMKAAKAAGFGRKILVLSGQSLKQQDLDLADEVWQSLHCAKEKFSENN